VGTILAISPHLDDAVLSYGGRLALLAATGHQVIVYTVFAGTPSPPYSPAATAYHEQWKLTGDPVQPRRDEDLRAMEILGAIPLHGRFLDAVYRRDGQGNWLGEPTEYQGDEPGLVTRVAATITQIIGERNPSLMVSCAAIGEHADHRRARDAAMMAAAGTGLQLRLWDDFPYVTWPEVWPEPSPELSLADAIAEPLTPAAVEIRNSAIRCYASQLAMLESDGIPMPRLFAEHCATHASRHGVTGFYELTRQVTPQAAMPITV
jgi:LmbE family N-acetylglucosaminyl deacetylase